MSLGSKLDEFRLLPMKLKEVVAYKLVLLSEPGKLETSKYFFDILEAEKTEEAP